MSRRPAGCISDACPLKYGPRRAESRAHRAPCGGSRAGVNWAIGIGDIAADLAEDAGGPAVHVPIGMDLGHDLVLPGREARPTSPCGLEELQVVAGVGAPQRSLVPGVGRSHIMAVRARCPEQGIDPRRRLWIWLGPPSNEKTRRMVKTLLIGEKD